MKNKFIIATVIFLLILVSRNVNAAEAEDISKNTKITYNNQSITKISDDNTSTKITIIENSPIKISSEQNIKSVYIKYENKAQTGILKYNQKEQEIGQNSFLHEYIELEEDNINEITITYNNKVQISEIYCFTEGEVPQWVQKWKVQNGNVDLMLFSTHSDDEHLFFAGLLPTYVAQNKNVQVIYLTNHNDNPTRLHEQLDGLWTVGVTNYPIIGEFPDAYAKSLDGAIANLKKSEYTQEDVIKFQVEQIRKYKPLVIVGHDINGEYSHGQHMLNADSLKQAIEKSNDSEYKDSTYEIWQTPKLYLHLYSEKQITMNYDTPLEYFNGKTAYQMSKLGYLKHKSQQYTWFTKWLNGTNNSYTSATQISTYSPTQFGLYYSSVGEDVNKNDMFENINKSDYRESEVKVENETLNQETSTLNNKKNIKIIIIVSIIIIMSCVIIYILKSIKKIR